MSHHTIVRGMTGPDRLHGAVRPARNNASAASASRKTFLARLGLPEDATNTEFEAALDQNKPKGVRAPLSADDALYEAMYGQQTVSELTADDEANYAVDGSDAVVGVAGFDVESGSRHRVHPGGTRSSLQQPLTPAPESVRQILAVCARSRPKRPGSGSR